MKLDPEFSTKSLMALGAEAADLLCRGDIDELGRRYGYAFGGGNDPAGAVRSDLARSLHALGAVSLAPAAERPPARVSYFKPNAPNLVALVECLVPTDNRAFLLVELVVAGTNEEPHITLEEISPYNGPHERFEANGKSLEAGGRGRRTRTWSR